LVRAAVSLRRSRMDEVALFGQFCRLTGYSQAGTGFALLMR
jgi:hypothetical protein